jgi:hypothetical protein
VFFTSIGDLMAVFPTGGEGQGHENALNTTVGGQTELRATVIDQVEFYVSTSSQLLPLLLLLSKR